jgi:hypothetical protein
VFWAGQKIDFADFLPRLFFSWVFLGFFLNCCFSHSAHSCTISIGNTQGRVGWGCPNFPKNLMEMPSLPESTSPQQSF